MCMLTSPWLPARMMMMMMMMMMMGTRFPKNYIYKLPINRPWRPDVNKKIYVYDIPVTAAEAVDREFVYIEMESLDPCHHHHHVD